MSPRDAELLDRWMLKGDAHAFDTLVSDYSVLVFSACRRVLRNDADAQDATQECFLQLANTRPAIRTSLAAWLHTVATRKALSRARSEARRTQREQAYSREQDTTTVAEWNDIQDFVDEAIDALPDDLRIPLVAQFLQRKTQSDVAEELGVDRSTVSRRVDRGIEELRTHLKKKGLAVPAAALTAMLGTNAAEALPVGLASTLARIALAGAQTPIAERAAQANTSGGLNNTLGASTLVKTATALFIIAAVFVGYWFVNAQPDPATTVASNAPIPPPEPASQPDAFDAQPATQTTPAAQPNVMPEQLPDPEPAESTEEASPVATTTVVGRVYDDATNAGLAGVTVAIYIFDGRIERITDAEPNIEDSVATAVTDSGGRFTIPGIGPGSYRIRNSRVEGYPLRFMPILEIGEPLAESVQVYIPLKRGGVLTGQVVLGGKPLANSAIYIETFSPGATLEDMQVRTDASGRYRIEGLHEFTGSMIAKRTQTNGNTQDALVVPAEIRYNETTEVNFDFAGGAASIRGTVYFGPDRLPIPANISVYFGWDDNGEYKEEIIRTNSDENGFYVAENLPAGFAEMHIFPRIANGRDIRRVEKVELSEGEQAIKDLYITDLTVQCTAVNLPKTTVDFFFFAHPGQADVQIKSMEDFIAMRDSMAAVSWNPFSQGKTELTANITGLEPGVYTISASSWPCEYTLAAVRDYGYERFFNDVVTLSATINVADTDQLKEVYFDFAEP